MHRIVANMQHRRELAVVSYGLLPLILITDSFTVLGFAHGIFYAPVLFLASLSGRRYALNIVLAISILFTWIGLFLTANPYDTSLPLFAYGNRALSTLLLLITYAACRLGMAFQTSQQAQQQQLQMAAQLGKLAKLGSWHLSTDGILHLSKQARRILNIDQAELSLRQFSALLIDVDGEHFLANMQPAALPLDIEYRRLQKDGELRWIRLVAYQDSQSSGKIFGVIQDTHSNRIIEAKMAEDERRFRFAGDSMQLFTWTARPDGELESVSRYTVDLLGASEKFIVSNWLNFLHPDDQQSTHNQWMHCVKTGEALVAEYRLRRHDGQYFWFLTRALPARDAQGNIFKWYGSGIDITESKVLQQHSENLSQQLQNTLASITDAFFTLDENLNFSYANEQAASLLERPRSALLNNLAVNETPIDADGSFSRQLERAVLSHKMTAFEFWYAGRELWLDVRIYPAADGLTVYLRDITRLRRDQDELILLRNAVSQLNDIVIITEATPLDEPGPKIVFVNDAFERITGYSREYAIGKSPRFLQGAKTQRSELDRIRQALISRQSVRAQLTNYHKNGDEVEIELNIVPIGVDSGRITHLVSIQRDITNERVLQKQLQLAQRMEAIGQLTGGIAHDFNNMLTVITGNNDLLQEALEKQPQLLSFSKLIGNAAERGAGLTRNLLTFARRQPLSPAQVDINQLIQQLQELLRSSLGAKSPLKLNLSTNLWPVMIDAVQLESSLLNLTINARDAMPESGELTISTANIKAQPLDEDKELRGTDWVEVSVQDTGSGIPKEMIDKIFEPFFTTKAAGKGSGLGLSMVFGFIKQSGGHIRVISEPGEGTIFKLLLPRAETEQKPEKTEPTPEVNHHLDISGHTILVVEDNDLVRQYASSQLRDAGYQVLEAAESKQALEWLNSGQRIDLLFTDVLMPDSLSGSELAKQAAFIRPELPVLYTSGYTENVLNDLSDEQRQQSLLHKPYHRVALLQRVAQAINAVKDS